MATYDFHTLDKLFKRKPSFTLTDAEYRELTGYELPKDKQYIKNSSAISRYAHKMGYVIDTVEEAPAIVRTIYFKKK